ncbi:hypothetical protein EVAR_82124_1 [Eumeta japonica]|uniref:Uncharacterized protein n=1 Tax=Eumeta variegata TaxID=151549 RepID=A0A4C1U1R7_EUMVA|nr:hypothetical protein EVAR_82124_1 [Eumeta japonica]
MVTDTKESSDQGQNMDAASVSNNDPGEKLESLHCNCIVRRRTVGCVHVMTVIWYPGWARHQSNRVVRVCAVGGGTALWYAYVTADRRRVLVWACDVMVECGQRREGHTRGQEDQRNPSVI